MTTHGDEGVGCGLVALALGTFSAFAVIAVALGLATTSFGLLFAGLPFSALLTALGGEFVLAWPVDAVVWIVASFAVARFTERRPTLRPAAAIAAVVALALVYGLLTGLLVEPSGEFFPR